MLNHKYKITLGKIFSPLKKTVIINSYGRSGSTLLTNSIVDSALSTNKIKSLNNSLKNFLILGAWSLDQTFLQSKFVYKTHDYPPESNLNKKDAKMVYIYADPVDVVLSLINIFNNNEDESWMKKHFEHLKSSYDNFNDIIYKDILGLENHFDNWLKEDRFPVAFIKYEHLWDEINNLSDFLDTPIYLPPYKKRKAKTKNNLKLVNELKQTYAPLRKKIDNKKNFFVNNIEK